MGTKLHARVWRVVERCALALFSARCSMWRERERVRRDPCHTLCRADWACVSLVCARARCTAPTTAQSMMRTCCRWWTITFTLTRQSRSDWTRGSCRRQTSSCSPRTTVVSGAWMPCGCDTSTRTVPMCRPGAWWHQVDAEPVLAQV
jgi:hypothetical protein